MAKKKYDPYKEGGITYTADELGKYKDGRLIPEKDYGYLPQQIGGTRGLPTTTTTPIDDGSVINTGSKTGVASPTFGNTANVYSPETMDILSQLKTNINTPWSDENLKSSALYKSQKESYEEMAKDAFSNTLGQLSSMTGGRPSSAAMGQAANASNYQLQQFQTQALPALTEQSYGMYQDQIVNQGKLLEIYMDKDLTEYDRTYQLMEFEWNRNENNPVVKGQILSNEMNQFKVDHQDEEWDLFVKESEAAIEYAEIINEYAPKEAESRLNQAYASYQNTMSMINSRELDDQRKADADKIKAEEDEGHTDKQFSNYLEVKKGLEKRTPEGAIAWMAQMGEERYIDLMGRELYNKMRSEFEDAAMAGPE